MSTDATRSLPRPSPAAPAAAAASALLDAVVAPQLPDTPLVAVCVDDRHPDLVGRVKVVWRPTPEAAEVERWVPALQSIVVRRGDRVVLLHPTNTDEPVVMGVVDGFARRADPEPVRSPTVELPHDEALRVVDRAGRPLLEIRSGRDGAELRLVDDQVALRVGGRFRIEAGSIEMRATEGGVDVEASDDVKIRGEVVKLN